MTTFCFDFGNTRLKCAIFIDSDYAGEVILQDDPLKDISALIDKHRPERAILSSVIRHDPGIEDLLSRETAFHKLSYDSKLPITSPVGKPQTIGADRLAMVVGAIHLFPRQHNLVIGLGTCITYNFVNKYQRVYRWKYFAGHGDAF